MVASTIVASSLMADSAAPASAAQEHGKPLYGATSLAQGKHPHHALVSYRLSSAPPVGPRAEPPDDVTITFSEFPVGTTITHQYAPEGVLFAGGIGGDLPYITDDAHNPSAPVLSGTPQFYGDISAFFVDTYEGAGRVVSGFSVDVGYIDDPGSTTMSLFNSSGAVSQVFTIEQTGIVSVNVGGGGISGFRVSTKNDTRGFAIDNLTFPGYPEGATQGPAIDEQGGAENPSEHDTTCYTARPVNCATGEFDHSFTDVSVPGRGPGLNLRRTYSSAAASIPGPFGPGWSYSYGMSATTLPSGDVSISQENGSQVDFSPDGSGGYVAPARVLASLMSDGEGGLIFTRRPDRTAYHFDATGRLMAIIARTGETSSLSYADDGSLAAVTDEAGRILRFSWSAGHIVAVTDPLGRTLSYGYDAAGDLVSATDRTDASWVYDYDTQHRLAGMTDPDGHTLSNSYDDQGRVTSQTDEAGLITTFGYSGDPTSDTGSTTTVTGPHGETTTYRYADLLLLQIAKATGYGTAATFYSYDPQTLGRTSVIDPGGSRTATNFDADGNVLSVMDPLGQTTTYTYDAEDEKTSQTTPMGETTTWTYSSPGVLQQVTDPTGAIITYQHDDAAHPAELTGTVDADGRITRIARDAYGDEAGRITYPTSSQSIVTQQVYDADGELLCSASGNAVAAGRQCGTGGGHVAGTTSYTHDGDGRPTAVTDPAGRTTTTSYDGIGNAIAVTDPAGSRTTRSYDGDGRLLTVTVAAGKPAAATTTYQYDLPAGTDPCATDQLPYVAYCSTITSPTGAVTVDWYGPRQELLGEQLPASGLTSYMYDLDLNQTLRSQSRVSYITYDYDADNRLRYWLSKGVASVFTYDGDGRRSSTDDGIGTTTYSRDADGRMTASTDGNGQTVSYTYDRTGDLTGITYPDGRQISRSYDGARRLVAITDPDGRTTSFDYDADGNVTSTNYPSGVASRVTYNPDDNSLGAEISSPAGDLATTALTRDADQRILTETDSGALDTTTTATYSARGELTSWSGQPYSYTAAGELTKAGSTRFTVNANSQLTKTSGQTATPIHYTVNDGGQRTDASAGTLGSLTYDPLGNLTQAWLRPILTSASPATGPAGTTIVLTGNHLNDVTKVKIGNQWGAAFTHIDDQHLQITMPPGGGTEPIMVEDLDVSEPVSFSYSGTGIASISPPAGRTAGGNSVTITGSGFTGTTAVDFGAIPAASFTVVDDTTLTAVAPANTPGTVDVTVTSPQGSSATNPDTGYGYSSGPIVTSLSPNTEFAGDSITIKGSGFSNASAVTFGDQPAQSFTIVSGSRITATVPQGTGTVDITVTSPKGISPTVHADQFTYPSDAPTPRSTSSFNYQYDADGLRHTEDTPSGITFDVWDTSGIEPQLIVADGLDLIRGPDGRPIEQIAADGTAQWFVSDPNGSTRLLLDNSGAVAASYDYTAYGTASRSSGTASTPFLFAGGLTEPATGLVLMTHREYDPITGRFTTVDPAVGLTHAPYSYAADDPLNRIDPTGLCPFDDLSRWAGYIAGAAGAAALLLGTAEVVTPAIGAAIVITTAVGLAAAVIGATIDCANSSGAQCFLDVVSVGTGAGAGAVGAASAGYDALNVILSSASLLSGAASLNQPQQRCPTDC